MTLFNRIFIFLFVILAWQGLAYAQALRLNYEQCVEFALKNNNQIRAGDYDIKASEAKLYQAHPKGIPVIKHEQRFAPVPQDLDRPAESFFDGDISPFYSLKIEMGSAITTFGKIKSAQNLAEHGIDGSQLKKLKTSDEVAFNIYQLYQGILLARELRSLANQAIDAMKSRMKELESAETSDQLQLLRLKVASYEVERKLGEANKKELLAISTLKMLLGLEDNANFDIASSNLVRTPFGLKPVDSYVEQSKTYLPEYRLLSVGLAAKEEQLRLQRKDPLPNLGAGAFFEFGKAPNLQNTDDENSFTNPFDYTRAGVGLQLKGEFDYVKNKALTQQLKSEMMKTVYERRAAIQALELDIRKTYLEVKEAEGLLAKVADEKKTARQIVFLTKSNLDIGLGERKDYVDGLQSYLILQGREFEAIFNYNVAVYNLKKRIGTLYSKPQEYGESESKGLNSEKP